MILERSLIKHLSSIQLNKYGDSLINKIMGILNFDLDIPVMVLILEVHSRPACPCGKRCTHTCNCHFHAIRAVISACQRSASPAEVRAEADILAIRLKGLEDSATSNAYCFNRSLTRHLDSEEAFSTSSKHRGS